RRRGDQEGRLLPFRGRRRRDLCALRCAGCGHQQGQNDGDPGHPEPRRPPLPGALYATLSAARNLLATQGKGCGNVRRELMSFRLFGVTVEIQIFFWVMAGVLGAMYLPPSLRGDWRIGAAYTAIFMLVVLVSVLVHEFGHAFAFMRH